MLTWLIRSMLSSLKMQVDYKEALWAGSNTSPSRQIWPRTSFHLACVKVEITKWSVGKYCSQFSHYFRVYKDIVSGWTFSLNYTIFIRHWGHSQISSCRFPLTQTRQFHMYLKVLYLHFSLFIKDCSVHVWELIMYKISENVFLYEMKSALSVSVSLVLRDQALQ